MAEPAIDPGLADPLEAALADRLEAEAALLAASPAAALAWAVAGLLGRAAGPTALVLPTAHLARLDGAPLAGLVTLAGGTVRPVGTIADCPEAALEAALAGAAAALVVVDPALPEVVAPARFLWLCRRAAVPGVILDPASRRWSAWADGGAALVVADGRALPGVEAGILAGTAEAVEACRRAAAAAAAFRAPEPSRAALAAALARAKDAAAG